LNRVLVKLALDNIQWLGMQSEPFAALVFFKFLRLSEEHLDNQRLRDQENQICVSIWRQKSVECKSIGREFVRIFTNVSNVPALQLILDDLKKDKSGGPIMRLILQERGHRPGE
jgi:hypothetical protein